MFSVYVGDTGGLLTSENHINFKWSGGNVFFSATQRGNALDCHFSAYKDSLRKCKEAINEFVEFAFRLFPWAEYIFAVVELPSVERLVKRCKFVKLIESDKQKVYMRER